MKPGKTTRPAASGHFHAVRFYEDDHSLCRIVAEFLGEGLIGGQPALVIATPEHRAGVLNELRARHVDVDRLQQAGDLLVLDARDTLSTFVADGGPVAELFKASITGAIERLRRGRDGCTVRAYGQMVDLL